MKIPLKEGTLLKAGTAVVGIVNVTPDSFFPSSRVSEVEEATRAALQMFDQGAAVVDIGGESTRPGSRELSPTDEISRVIPVVEMIRHERSSALLSVDTRHPETAEAAFVAGASILNDITGLCSERMLDLVSQNEAPIVIMHMRGIPENMQNNPEYEDVVREIMAFLESRAVKAIEHGISKERIILDPGIGFGKSYRDNIEILANIRRFKELGFPIMIGHSRKSFIGKILDLPVEERLEGTLAITAYCAMNGVEFVRVHDVKENIRVIETVEAIKS